MKIYLACPYSDDDSAVKEARFQAVSKKAASLIKHGHTVFSPISHSHPITMAGELPGSYEYWLKFDKDMMDWADEIWVLMLPGWQGSIGVRAEMAYAEATDKPVVLVNEVT